MHHPLYLFNLFLTNSIKTKQESFIKPFIKIRKMTE